MGPKWISLWAASSSWWTLTSASQQITRCCLYLADTGLHIKSDHMQIQKCSSGAIRSPLFPDWVPCCLSSSRCFHLKLWNVEGAEGSILFFCPLTLQAWSLIVSASRPVRKRRDGNQDCDLVLHTALSLTSAQPLSAAQMSQDRDRRDATDWNNGKSVLGIGVEFGEGNVTMHSHRRESGLISSSNAAWLPHWTLCYGGVLNESNSSQDNLIRLSNPNSVSVISLDFKWGRFIVSIILLAITHRLSSLGAPVSDLCRQVVKTVLGGPDNELVLILK